jgi:hypothetical protein
MYINQTIKWDLPVKGILLVKQYYLGRLISGVAENTFFLVFFSSKAEISWFRVPLNHIRLGVMIKKLSQLLNHLKNVKTPWTFGIVVEDFKLVRHLHVHSYLVSALRPLAEGEFLRHPKPPSLCWVRPATPWLKPVSFHLILTNVLHQVSQCFDHNRTFVY